MVMQLDLDKIVSINTRKNLKEALSCFDNHDYRAAINMLYPVTIADLVEKMNIMATKDGEARKIVKNIPTNSDIVLNNKDQKKSKGDRWEKWENDFIYSISTNMLSSSTIGTLRELKMWRNFCSHPSIVNSSVVLKSPDKYLVTYLFNTMYRDIFSVSPKYFSNRNAFDNFTNLISNRKEDLFMLDDKQFKDYIIEQIQTVRPDNISWFIKNLYKFTFLKSGSLYDENRQINLKALNVLVAYKKENDPLKNILDERTVNQDFLDHLNEFLIFLNENPETWEMLTENNKEMILNKISKCDKLTLLQESSLLPKKQFKEKLLELSKNAENDCQDIVKSVRELSNRDYVIEEIISNAVDKETFNDLLGLLIKYLNYSSSFSSTDIIFDYLIPSELKLANKENVTDLIAAINDNDQVYNCFEFKNEDAKDKLINIIDLYKEKTNKGLDMYANLQKALNELKLYN